MASDWKDRPDEEGFWWVRGEDGRRTVAQVTHVHDGIVFFRVVGLGAEFTDEDFVSPRFAGKKWKRVSLT